MSRRSLADKTYIHGFEISNKPYAEVQFEQYLRNMLQKKKQKVKNLQQQKSQSKNPDELKLIKIESNEDIEQYENGVIGDE